MTNINVDAIKNSEGLKMQKYMNTFFEKRAELTEKYIKNPTDPKIKGNQLDCNHHKNMLSYYIKVNDIVCKCNICGKEIINPDYIRALCEEELGYSYDVPGTNYLA